MLDVLADQTESRSCVVCPDYRTDLNHEVAQTGRNLDLADADLEPTFRCIKVLMVETQGHAVDNSIIEQCLRYMVKFECQITQAGSQTVAEFALQADTFDLVISDEHSLDVARQHPATPSIIIAGQPSSETTRKALAAGALHCLPLTDLSPRLLEIAINQCLSDET